MSAPIYAIIIQFLQTYAALALMFALLFAIVNLFSGKKCFGIGLIAICTSIAVELEVWAEKVGCEVENVTSPPEHMSEAFHKNTERDEVRPYEAV